MSWVKIPVRSDIYNYSMRIELDSQIYILTFRYNKRMDSWFMDIADEQENDIVAGLICKTNFPLTKDLIIENMPQSNFIIVNTSGEDVSLGQDNFGTDFVLLYGE